MIPQGLYIMTTIALSAGVIELSKKNTLVQDIYCIEMLARVDVLCLDKTGTITDGIMTVVRYIEKQKNLHPEDGVYYDKVDANKIKKAIETINNLKYRTLIREKRFIMYIPHNRIVENSTIEDRVLIQGIVDLIVMGENKNIIIDYKTTKVDTADQLVEKYGLQLKLYKQAIEGAMGIKVDEMWVYSLFLDKLVKID
jgi:ATP-dependent exoDNAse (exonuclease V) beta subunit